MGQMRAFRATLQMFLPTDAPYGPQLVWMVEHQGGTGFTDTAHGLERRDRLAPALWRWSQTLEGTPHFAQCFSIESPGTASASPQLTSQLEIRQFLLGFDR